ncbi:Protein Daple [Trichinella patagoniensis]|uniref:Protein Daple n=1 Tax=Trichinella patagoniensis TaxID=990121 RepID=A0A0V0ZQZ9_9BILA|nr:Protein Daple [Trichinella patagoniensis]
MLIKRPKKSIIIVPQKRDKVNSTESIMPATKSCKKDAFFSHALYAWLQTCPKSFNEAGRPVLVNNSTAAVPQISFLELCNGVTLNGLMHYIQTDHQMTHHSFANSKLIAHCKKEPLDLNVSGVGARLRNLRLLIQSIQSFYKDVLNQHIIMPLPDMLAIAKSPFPDITGDEMKKVLLLLLGCAVQSDRREEFINQIKSLDNCTQQAIVDEIRKVTSEASCVLNAHMLDEFVNDERLAVLVKQLLIVVHERDQYAQHLLEANQEQQELDGSSALSSCNGGNACSGKLSENQQQATEYPDESVSRHCAVEIADLKAKVRRLRQDLDERNEMLSIYKEEIVEKDTVLAKMRQENFELMKSHRALNDYRDEVDALREKSERCDRLEEDCERMKEKLEELDFYKSRIDELREENHVLLETRNIYEEQLNGFRCRLAQLSEKETEVIKLERRLVDMEQEMEADKRRLEQLYDENVRLEKECRDGQSRSAKLQAELSRLTECGPHKKHEEIGCFSSANVGSLSSQLSESTIARIHKLELENQRLRQRCDLETVSVASSVEQQSEEKEGILQELRCKNDALCDQLVKLEQKETSLQKQLFELESEKQIMQQRIDELELQINNKNTGADDDDDADGGGGKKKSISSDERRQHEVGEMELLQNELVERNAQIAIFEQELSSAESKLKLAEADLRRLENEQITTQAQFASLQRDRSFLENENAKVKQSLESADAELEQCRQRLGRLEVEHERLATVRLQYDELSAHMDSLQSTNRRLQQQLEVEANKNQALAEDLVNEKRKIHSFEQLITEMRSSLNTSSEEENPVDDEKQRCANEDDPRILFWRVIQRLKNQIASGQQQLECSENELAALRQQIASQCAFAATDEQRQSSTVLADVTDSVENIRLKNRLLIDENSNIRQQVHILQSQIEKYCNEAQMTSNENLKLRQELREMQIKLGSGRQAEAENAGLQVELRSLQLNHDVIKKENVELQNQCDNWERGAALARRGFEELQKQHRLLLDDHEHLQALHEQLGRDYERLCNDVRQFKVQLKQARLEKAEQATRLEQLTEENSRLVRLGASERQRDEQQQQRECRLLASLQSEHGQLKKAHDELNGRLEVTSRELETSRAQNRILRAQANAAQLQLAQQQGKCDDVDEARRRVELELAKAEHRCETLTRMNENLEEERRNLLRQLDSLISQQQGLLKQTLLEKDHHHAEEKQLQDQLYKLQSHKEKLEEKIMQQYKTITPNSKRKDRSAFVKRAAKAFLMPRASTRKNNNTKVRESSAEESAMSADESGFFGNFSRTSSSSRKKYCTLPKSAKLASRSPGKTAFSPLLTNREKIKMHHSRSNSASTQQSSSLSSDSVVAASLAARQRGWSSRWPGDRVSFSGSERAVDVPNDPMNSQSTVHKGSLPSPATAMQPRTPPPYRCAVQRRDTLAASPLRAVPSLLANGHLGRLPPPYPGKKAAPCTAESSNLLCSRTALEQSVAQLQRDLGLPSSKIPNHSNVQNGANDNNGSDNNTVTSVADELFSNLSSVSSIFAPPKASTPKSDDNNSSATSSSAMAPLHPGNNSLVSSEPSSNGSVAAQVDTDVTPKRRPLTTTRQAVRSIYDNVPTTSGNDQPNQKSAAQLEDDEDSSIEKTLTELLRDCKTEHENAVWFEYGCV